MPIESFSYITSLNSSNPGGSDGVLQGDDHIRGIKATLLASFPNIDAAVETTPGVLNDLQDGTFTGDFNITGRLTGNGSCPTGMIADFVVIPTGWLECNGQSVLRASYPDLFSLIGTTYGAADGTHFSLPNMTDRYRRARGTNAVNATLSNQNKSHSHTASTSGNTGNAGTHSHGSATGGQSATHTHSGTTGAAGSHAHTGTTSGDGSHSHSYTRSNDSNQGGILTGGGVTANSGVVSTSTGDSGFHSHTLSIDAVGDHTHSFTTGNASGDHTHSIASDGLHFHLLEAVTTVSADGGTEARPDTFVVITCMKT